MPSDVIPYLITAQQDFSPLVSDVGITLAGTGQIPADALLALRSLPNGLTGASVNDLRIRWDSEDVTTAYKENLRQRLASASPSVLEAQYHAGIYDWWKRNQPTGEYNNDASTSAVAQALKATAADIIARFTTLGDTRDACRGNLHPLNYLYHYIDVEPISIVASLSTSHVTPTSRLRISSGPFIDDPAWVAGPVSGAIHVSLLLSLPSESAAITDALDEISAAVSTLYGLLVINGPHYAKLVAINTAVTALQQQLNDTVSGLGTPAEIAAISGTLTDIKNILHMQDNTNA
jgi:hypothetical protein